MFRSETFANLFSSVYGMVNYKKGWEKKNIFHLKINLVFDYLVKLQFSSLNDQFDVEKLDWFEFEF